MPVPQERRKYCYPPLPVVEMIQGYAAINECSESSAITEAVKGFFQSLPPSEKIRIVNAAKEIKQQQKRHSKNSY